MGVALINKNSQGAKNGVTYNSLEKVAGQHGPEVDSHDMYTTKDKAQITYVQAGTLTTAVLNGKATDYVITGYGTGEEVILACNSSPGVVCGYVEDALNTYILTQINSRNVIVIPFAKRSGWGGDLNLEYIFEKLFCESSGQGYPRERAVPEQRNKRILDDVRKAAFRRGLVEIFKELDQGPVRGVFAGEEFGELFLGRCEDERLTAYTRELIG